MRDWPSAAYDGSLEQACTSVAHYPSVERIALEVQPAGDPNGPRYVLTPVYDPGLPPWSGESVRCSALSFDSLYEVVRVGKGYPGAMIWGRYPDDFPPGRR